MIASLALINPLDTLTGERVAVRVASANDRRITGLGGAVWEPAMVTPPSLGINLWNGDFSEPVSVAGATLPINMTVLKETYGFADELIWTNAPVTIYAERPGTIWPWVVRFKGKVSAFSRKGATLALTVEVDTEPFKAKVLTRSYAGTGGAEGPADLKNRVKPLVLGWAQNVEPVLINAVDSVYQFSAYGAIESLSNLYERGSDFGAAVANYASYTALQAATIPAGRWATCLAEGMVRLGAPAYGVITGDVKGHCVGATTPRLTGAMISALAQIAGVDADLLDSGSLARLDLAVPYSVNLNLTDQVEFLDLAQAMALCCNAQSGVFFDGRFTALRISLDNVTEALILDAQGRAWPQVSASEEASVSPPYFRTTLGANRCWRVHTADEISFAAPIIDRGRYDAATSYREGNYVNLADGSEWLYINATASTGNTPPTWPTTSNAYWQNKAPPTNLSALTNDAGFVDGPGAKLAVAAAATGLIKSNGTTLSAAGTTDVTGALGYTPTTVSGAVSAVAAAVTGIVKSNGSALSAAVAGTDYQAPVIIAQSAVAASVTGTTTETTLATITVPANAMGANGRIEIHTMWSTTNSANNKTLKVKFGGTTLQNIIITTTASIQVPMLVANRNNTGSQVASPNSSTGSGATTNAVQTAAVDTTSAVTILITGQLANAGETITLEAYSVKLFK